MILCVGLVVVFGSVLAGFSMAGGHVASLIHASEIVTIGGAALGALIIMSPPKVIGDIAKSTLSILKGSPWGKPVCRELLVALYEFGKIVRRDGALSLESHVTDPSSSDIFRQTPRLRANREAMHFLTNSLSMLVDGMSADAIVSALEDEIKVVERERHMAIAALNRTADSLPGFGIVAAVLGIVVTMGHIDGPVEEIGHKVGAALVGTFLGILLSYGLFSPLAGRMEVAGEEEKVVLEAITTGALTIHQGVRPREIVTAVTRQLNTNCRPSLAEIREITGEKS